MVGFLLCSIPSVFRFPVRSSPSLIVSGWLHITLLSFLFLRVTLPCIWFFFLGNRTRRMTLLLLVSRRNHVRRAALLEYGSNFGNLTPLTASVRLETLWRSWLPPASSLVESSQEGFPTKCCVVVQVSIFLGATWLRISPQLPVNSAHVTDQEAFRCL